LLIAVGQHPKVIQERLGHASITTTLDVFSLADKPTQNQEGPSLHGQSHTGLANGSQ
jgi:hypothetical protein